MKFAIFLFSFLHISLVSAGVVTIVNAADSAGSNFTLAAPVLLSDTITINVTGEVFLQGIGRFGTNASGVLTTVGSHPVGQTLANGSTNFGELLLGNTTLGFKRLFPASAATGLGSSNPPNTLNLGPVTFGSLGFSSNLAAGTVLVFLVSDTQYGDNFGSFTVTSDLNTSAAVPEQGTLVLVGFSLLCLGRLYRRK